MTTMMQRIRRNKAIGSDLRIRPGKLRTRHQRKVGENHLVKNQGYSRQEARDQVKKVARMRQVEYRSLLVLSIHNTAKPRAELIWGVPFTAGQPSHSMNGAGVLSPDLPADNDRIRLQTPFFPYPEYDPPYSLDSVLTEELGSEKIPFGPV